MVENDPMNGWGVQIASDVIRDGLGVELLDSHGTVVAEVFHYEATQAIAVSLFAPDIPLNVMEWLLLTAKRRLQQSDVVVAVSNSKTSEYRLHIALIHEDEGKVSAIVLNLPGVGSSGDNEEEALANVRDAIAATIASYSADKVPIPWLEPDGYAIPTGARVEWISVDA